MDSKRALSCSSQVREPEFCPFCGASRIIRRGMRAKKRESVQRYLCKNCGRRFTGQTLRGRQFPLSMILEGLSLYHLGHSAPEVCQALERKFGLEPDATTLQRWLRDFASYCPYQRLRERGLALFKPQHAVESVRLQHNQNYDFRWHRAKMAVILEDPIHRRFECIRDLLQSVGPHCPHELFRGNGRGSQLKRVFSQDELRIERKENRAVEIARFVLQAVPKNILRHEAIQRFMLLNDSVTVATELPVLLEPEDIAHFRDLGFALPSAWEGVMTGHIDLIQIRNGNVHILDFKPGARSVDAVDQLTFYALALSRLTGLRLMDIACGWFDETAYFGFRPLHAVYKLGGRRREDRRGNPYRKGA